MCRSLLLSALCLALVTCAGKESSAERIDPSDEPAKARPAPSDGEEPSRCEALLAADDVSIRHIGQGSHGAASTDVTIDLTTHKMTGTDYKLDADGNTPIPLTVDQQVAPEVLAALRGHMEAICAPREIASADEHAANGGSTRLEIKHADGTSLFVALSSSAVPAGATMAAPSRDEWIYLFELWPRAGGT